jgi:hypothetical protein
VSTHIGTLESSVELVSEATDAPGSQGRNAIDDRTRRCLQAKREQSLRRRTHAEGLSD